MTTWIPRTRALPVWSIANYTMVPNNTDQYLNGAYGQYVDADVNVLRIVVAGKQAEADITGAACSGYFRKVEILAPWQGPNDRWYPVSPRLPALYPGRLGYPQLGI